jgi:hypothetical protein
LEAKLEPGNYVIIPSTFAPYTEASFKLIVQVMAPVNAAVTLQPIDYGFAECAAEWMGASAGGCVNYPTWRDNPQFLLTLEQDSSVQILLETNLVAELGHHIGFYVVKAGETDFKKVILSPTDVVADCKYAAKTTVSTRCLLKMADGPFVLIPSTFAPGIEASFHLAVSGFGLGLTRFREDLWRVQSLQGEWRGPTAGGCKNYGSWVANPQFALYVEAPTAVVIVLCQTEKNNYHGIGFYVLEQPTADSSPARLIAKSKFVTAIEGALEVPLQNPGNYIIIPTTFEPGKEDYFSVTVYSKVDFSLQSILSNSNQLIV